MDKRISVAYILPTFGHFDYASRCLRSLDLRTHYPGTHGVDATAIVIDDGSPDWSDQWFDTLPVACRMAVFRFPENGGLTRAWNAGVRAALQMDVEYVILGNSDVLFTSGWWRGMVEALDREFAFVGPVTNAPGSQSLQDVRDYCMAPYREHLDAPDYLDAIGRRMFLDYGGRVRPCAINGFFMMGKADAFRQFAHDDANFFPPRIDIMPSGRKNPTPLMTGQEDWLNARVRQANQCTGAALGSFIFHYRSVTRGQDKHGKGQAVKAS